MANNKWELGVVVCEEEREMRDGRLSSARHPRLHLAVRERPVREICQPRTRSSPRALSSRIDDRFKLVIPRGKSTQVDTLSPRPLYISSSIIDVLSM